MDKNAKLEKVADEIKNCNICPVGKSGLAVPGEGNPDARIVFIGEAPGKNEAKVGRPFIGRSGQLLRKSIKEVGLTEEEVYITSPVKYLPDRGTPTKEDIAHGKIHLDKQLEVIDPEIIVLLGSTAVQAVLGEKIPIAKEHGKVVERNGKRYLIVFHPAAAIRFQKFRKLFDEDFRKLGEVWQEN